MVKDISVGIRLDSQLKEQTESVLEQFGLNMTAVVNMLFHQIVREQAIPLTGRNVDNVADDMERIITEVEYGAKKV